MDLSHNYHELTSTQKLRYWTRDRWRLSPADRFFYEGHRALQGQMYLAERKALYTTVLERKPAFCFEIGTASGGGSTLFIASAFRRLGSGKLVSLEAVPEVSRGAAYRYRRDLKHLQPYVDFLVGTSPTEFLPYIQQSASTVECFFLDGSNMPEETVAQYQFFVPYVRNGTILMAHDWDDQKMRLLRPMIEADRSWQLLTGLHQPVSVGFVVYARAGVSDSADRSSFRAGARSKT